MLHRRSTWIWGGRLAAAAVLAALAGYLWTVGLDKAGQIASILGLLVAVAALVAPYLFPLAQSSGNNSATPAVVVSPGPGPRGGGTVTRKGEWVAIIMTFTDIEDPEFRRAVLRMMGDLLHLGHAFSVPYRPVARDHVVEIVDRCWDFRDSSAARRALADAFVALRPDDGASGQLALLSVDV